MNQPKPSLQATRNPFRAPHFPFPTTPSIKLPVQPLVEEPAFNPALVFHGLLQADLILHKELEYDILVTTSQLLLLSKDQDLSDLVDDQALILTLYCLPRWDWTPSVDAIRYRALISVFDAKNREAGCTGLVAGPYSPSIHSALLNLRWNLDLKIRFLESAVARVELAGREWMFWPTKQAVDGLDDSSGPELSLYRHANFEYGATDEDILKELGFDDRRSFVWPCDMEEGRAGGIRKEEGQDGVVKKEEAQADYIKQEETQADGIKREDVQADTIKKEEVQTGGIKQEEV